MNNDQSISTQKQYEAHVDGFTMYINKLANKVAMFTYLKHNDEGDGPSLAPVLFLTVKESLLADSVISLARLYEAKNRSHSNLNKFLGFVEANRGKISWRHESITHEQIEEQKQLITSKQESIKHVLAQRDQYFAHHDKKYFLDYTGLNKEYPISISDVEDLIIVAQKINNVHYRALKGSTPVTLHEFHALSLDNLINTLRTAKSKTEVSTSMDN